MANATWQWDEFWGAVNGAPMETLVEIGRELNGEDFVRWFSRKSHRTQEEIMESAPESVQQHFYSLNAIKPITVMSLGITPKRNIKITDRRTVNASRQKTFRRSPNETKRPASSVGCMVSGRG